MAMNEDELLNKVEAKTAALADSAAAKEAVLNGSSSLPPAFPEVTQYAETGRTIGNVPEDPFSRNVQLSDNLFQNRDGSYTYIGYDGIAWSSPTSEGILELIQDDERALKDSKLSDNEIIDTAAGVAESGQDLWLKAKKAYTTTGDGYLGLEEALNAYNRKNNPTMGSEFYDESANPINVKEVISKYRDVKKAQFAKTPLTPEQEEFAASQEFAIAEQGSQQVENTYKALDEIDKEKWDISRKLDDRMFERAYREIDKQGGAWEAFTFALDNPSYFAKKGIESAPYMVALATGGAPGAAILLTYGKGLAAENTQQFVKENNGRQPTEKEQFLIDSYSMLTAVAERYADRLLLGKAHLTNKMLGNLTSKLPKPLQFLLSKTAGVAAEGGSGASTEILTQLAVKGEVDDWTGVRLGATTEAFASPTGAATYVVGKKIVDKAFEEKINAENIYNKIAENEARIDKFSDRLTDAEVKEREDRVADLKVEILNALEQEEVDEEAVGKLNREAGTLLNEINLRRKIPLDENGDVKRNFKLLLQRRGMLEQKKEKFTGPAEPSLGEKLKGVVDTAKEDTSVETRVEQATQEVKLDPDSPDLAVEPETADTPTRNVESENYDPVSALELSINEAEAETSLVKINDLFASMYTHLENYNKIDKNIDGALTENEAVARGKELKAQREKVAELRDRMVKLYDKVEQLEQEEQAFPDTESQLAQIKDDVRNSIDEEGDLQEYLTAQEFLDATYDANEKQRIKNIVDEIEDSEVQANQPAPPKGKLTAEQVNEAASSNEQVRGEKRLGYAQHEQSITSSTTLPQLNARLGLLNKHVTGKISKLKAFRNAFKAFKETGKHQVIYQKRDKSFDFIEKGQQYEGNQTFEVTNANAVIKVGKFLAEEVQQGEALLTKMEQFKRDNGSRLNANTRAVVDPEYTPPTRTEPAPEIQDTGTVDAAPAVAPQSAAAINEDAIVEKLFAKLAPILQGMVGNQQQATETVNQAVADEVAETAPSEEQATSPVDTEWADPRLADPNNREGLVEFFKRNFVPGGDITLVDNPDGTKTRTQSVNPPWVQEAIRIVGSGPKVINALEKALTGARLGKNQLAAVQTVLDAAVDPEWTPAETQPQEAPQTPETATPAEAETTAAPVQEEQAIETEDAVESASINTKAAFIAKYAEYMNGKKLIKIDDISFDVLQEMAADLGACK